MLSSHPRINKSTISDGGKRTGEQKDESAKDFLAIT